MGSFILLNQAGSINAPRPPDTPRASAPESHCAFFCRRDLRLRSRACRSCRRHASRLFLLAHLSLIWRTIASFISRIALIGFFHRPVARRTPVRRREDRISAGKLAQTLHVLAGNARDAAQRHYVDHGAKFRCQAQDMVGLQTVAEERAAVAR